MLSYLRILVLFLLFETVSFVLTAQNSDTLNSVKTAEPLNLLIIKDSTNEVKTKVSNILKNSPDTVFLKNGDKITGRILSLEQGRVKIDAQSAGVINIKWHKIATIRGGIRAYKVEDIYGTIYIGLIQASTDTGTIIVASEVSHKLMLAAIVSCFPLEEKWYRGFKGNLGAGVSYTKSSDVLTINAEYNLYYVFKKWKFKNDFSYISTKTDDEATSIRIQTNFQALYALKNKWVLSEINSFNRNDELGIRSRISFGLGGGHNLVQTAKQNLLILTGIVQNSEKNIESNEYTSNFEWPVTIQHTVYSFARPDLSSSTSLTSFVGITENGRYRFDANTDISWEFVTNLKLQLTFYYNFDNNEVEGKTTEEDYGTVLSLIFDLK